jgi:thioredoxin reductase
MKHIVIIGNGISGVTAARHIRKNSKNQITLVSGEAPYFFSRTALMYVYMGHMEFKHTQPYENWFWEKNKIDLKQGFVNRIDTDDNCLIFEDNTSLSYDQLVIACGSKPNKFGWPGQDSKGVMGLYHKQDLEQLEQFAPNNQVCKRAVIVGGGLIGIELAEMLRSRNIPVTFLVREKSFWNDVLPDQESEMINRHIREHHVDLRLSAQLREIKANASGQVTSVIIEETGEEIFCDVVGLTAGVSPNIDFVKGSNIVTGSETLAQTICKHRTAYHPGHWFNSAKFFDIEYQTYGWVWAKPKENEARFYWEHKNGKMCIHLNYDKNTHQFIGINNFGIRMRHAFFDKILTKKKSVTYVLAHLSDANFDPEFYKKYASEIVSKFNQENNTSIELKKKSWKRVFSEA